MWQASSSALVQARPGRAAYHQSEVFPDLARPASRRQKPSPTTGQGLQRPMAEPMADPGGTVGCCAVIRLCKMSLHPSGTSWRASSTNWALASALTTGVRGRQPGFCNNLTLDNAAMRQNKELLIRSPLLSAWFSSWPAMHRRLNCQRSRQQMRLHARLQC